MLLESKKKRTIHYTEGVLKKIKVKNLSWVMDEVIVRMVPCVTVKTSHSEDTSQKGFFSGKGKHFSSLNAFVNQLYLNKT